jgi:putative hemolysin
VTVFLEIVAVGVLILANAIFVAAEYGLITARRARLEERARDGSRAARTALRLMDTPARFISTVQVGITISGIMLGALGEPLVSRYFDFLPRSVAFVIAFLVLTYLSVVFGELVPKTVTLQRAETVAVLLAIPLDWLGKITYPLVWLLQVSGNAVSRLFGIEPAPAGVLAHTEEDIRHIVAEAEDEGVIEEAEEEMLYKVFDFADKEAHEVMVPRPEVVALSVDLPPVQCLASLIDSPYTRYPVYRGSLDDVLGILHVRDLFSALYDRGIENVDVASLVRPVMFVPETKDLAALLAEFRKANQHMAVVVDEYGAFEGIVTLEDLLEEIVGEIEDEYDLPDESVERLDDHRIRIDGTFPIDDFNEQFGQQLPQEDYHTVAGYVFGQLGRVAEPGDEVVYDGLRLQVVDVDGPRIERLEIEFRHEDEAPQEAAASGE